MDVTTIDFSSMKGRRALLRKINELEKEIELYNKQQKNRIINIKDSNIRIVKNNNSVGYSIIAYTKSPAYKVIIKEFLDADEEYDKNCAEETLEYLIREN